MFAGCPVTSPDFCNAIGLTTDKQCPATMGETMRSFVCAAVMLASAALPVFAQTAPAPAVLKDLAPTGKLRAAINFGNGVLAQKGPNGEPRGVSAELAAALAKRLGVPLNFVPFEAAGKVFEALASDSVDVGFIAI